jgi:hypothetical protein
VLGLLEAGSGKRRTMTEDKNLNGHPGVEVEVRGNTSTSGRSFTLASQISTQASTPLVERFSSEDFLIVIDRCESIGIDGHRG